jgi:ankyrin repeat protein
MIANRSLASVIVPAVVSCVLSGCFLLGPDTPLGRAASGGDLVAMTALLDHGADPNAAGAHGLTPLASAARNGRVEAIDLLLARGADPHRGCGVNGWSPLLHALHKDQQAAAERLMVTCTAPSAELDEALFMAAGYAQVDAINALLKQGADPRKDFGDGANALSNAVAGAFDIDFSFRGCAAHTAAARALLIGPDVRLEGSVGTAARRAALRRGCTDMVLLLDGSQAEQHNTRR